MTHAGAIKLAAGSVVGGMMIVCLAGQAATEGPRPRPATLPSTQPAQVRIDLDAAVAVELPAVASELTPAEFKTRDGRGGWIVKIPGGRPIATPAYADGMLFVGGGYGSHEFYAFDAATGKKVWGINCADDGPTAAVVEDGYCAFNTESCTVIVVEPKTGKLVWQEWLGDPLMSQPAIANGKLYIAYPGGHPRGQNQAAQRANGEAKAADAVAKPVGPAKGNGHRLLCADLKTGKHLWEQDISGDIISAPVVEGNQVFFTCFDGTSFAVQCPDGAIAWQKHNAGTSAPIVAEGQVLLTERQQVGKEIHEGVKRLEKSQGVAQDKELLASSKAAYLENGKEGAVALAQNAQANLDSAVGFGGAAPATAGLNAAKANVNVATVAGAWAYQGSRAAYSRGQILNIQANQFNCIRAKDGTIAWQAQAVGKGVSDQVQSFSPPAVAGGKLYVCSARGDLIAMGENDGKTAFVYSTGAPMVFQPSLARGNLYAGTADGRLICLKTGDASADGWTAWGGNAQHNKKE